MILYEILISIAILSLTLPTTAQLMIGISKTLSSTHTALHTIRETSYMEHLLRTQFKDAQSIQWISGSAISILTTTGETIEYGITSQKLYIKKGTPKVTYTDQVKISQFNIRQVTPKLLTITLNQTPITIHLPNVH
jgi:competence protein ComGF